MRGTAFLCAAYHDVMEIALLIALFAANNDPSLAEKLRSFLAFYRENRELIASLSALNSPVASSSTEKKAPMSEEPPLKEAEKERRTPSGNGAEKILEAYLNRLG